MKWFTFIGKLFTLLLLPFSLLFSPFFFVPVWMYACEPHSPNRHHCAYAEMLHRGVLNRVAFAISPYSVVERLRWKRILTVNESWRKKPSDNVSSKRSRRKTGKMEWNCFNSIIQSLDAHWSFSISSIFKVIHLAFACTGAYTQPAPTHTLHSTLNPAECFHHKKKTIRNVICAGVPLLVHEKEEND